MSDETAGSGFFRWLARETTGFLDFKDEWPNAGGDWPAIKQTGALPPYRCRVAGCAKLYSSARKR